MKNSELRSLSALLVFLALALMMAAVPSARAQTFTSLWSFQGPPLDGWGPQGTLVFDQSGSVYGVTIFGGTTDFGTLFKFGTSGNEIVLHNFQGTRDGASPTGQVVRYGGKIYGVTESGGGGAGCGSGCGTVFAYSSDQQENIVHSFEASDGGYTPAGLSGLIRDTSGNMYGTTYYGSSGPPPSSCGNQGNNVGCGTVFEVSNRKEQVLYSFGGKPDGAGPEGSLIVDRAGNLYGVTGFGGTFDCGSIFELSPNTDGSWTEQVLYSFRGTTDGAGPQGVSLAVNGDLYGVAESGGEITDRYCKLANGCGVAFKLKKNPDGSWSHRTLHTFTGPPLDGYHPLSNLTLDGHGNIYGVTLGGGTQGYGIVFKLDAAGNETILHSFDGIDGLDPESGLVMDANGNLFGTTVGGGNSSCSNGCGTIFKITP
jgi:uncharacterized repeat protein (TIGR03803 family)